MGTESGQYTEAFGVEDSNRQTWEPFVNVGSFATDRQYVQIDPDDPDTLYTGSRGSGFWKSVDRGRTWSPKSRGMRNLMVDLLRMSPLGDDTLYAAESRIHGAGNGAFFRSTDRGETWEPLHACAATFAPRTWFNSMDIGEDSAGAPNLWVSMFFSKSDCGLLFRSTDGGDTWCSYTSTCSSDWSQSVPGLECASGVGDITGNDSAFVRHIGGTDEVYFSHLKQNSSVSHERCQVTYRTESLTAERWELIDAWIGQSSIFGSDQCRAACQDRLRSYPVEYDPENTEYRFARYKLLQGGGAVPKDLDLAYHDGRVNLRGERLWDSAFPFFEDCDLGTDAGRCPPFPTPPTPKCAYQWDVQSIEFSTREAPADPKRLFANVHPYVLMCDASSGTEACFQPANWTCIWNFSNQADPCASLECPVGNDWLAGGRNWSTTMRVMDYAGIGGTNELLFMTSPLIARHDILRLYNDGSAWHEELLTDPITCKGSAPETLTPLQVVQVTDGPGQARLIMSAPRNLAFSDETISGGQWLPLVASGIFFDQGPLLAQWPGDPQVAYYMDETGIMRSTDGFRTKFAQIDTTETRAGECNRCAYLGPLTGANPVCATRCFHKCGPDPPACVDNPPFAFCCYQAEWDQCTNDNRLPSPALPGCGRSDRCGRLNPVCGNITDFIVDAQDDEKLWAATEQGIWTWEYPFTGAEPCYPAIPIDELTFVGAGWAGEVWEPLQPICPPPGGGECIKDLYFRKIGQNPDVPGILLAAGKDTLYRSTTGGLTWSVASELPGVVVERILFKPPLVFLGTETGLYRSVDGGLNFGPLPLLALPVRDVATLDGVTLYAAVMDWDESTFAEGVYKSADGGAAWNKVVAAQDNQWAMSVFVKDPGGEAYVGLLGSGLYQLTPSSPIDCGRLTSKSKGGLPGDILMGSALTSVGDFVDTIQTKPDCQPEWAALEFDGTTMEAVLRIFDKEVQADRGTAPHNTGIEVTLGWGSLQGIGDRGAGPSDCPDIAVGLPFATSLAGIVKLIDACTGLELPALQEITPQFGMSLARSGDFLAVGAPGGLAPRVYVYDLNALPAPIRTIASPAGPGATDFGWSVAFGDMNADGFPDLAVGAPVIDVVGSGAFIPMGPGKVYVFSGHDNWTTLLRTLSPPTTQNAAFGYAVRSGYDRLGTGGPDGADDLVVGAPAYPLKGAAFWYKSSADTAPVVLQGEVGGDYFGTAVLLTRDATGDLLPDLVVGAPRHGATRQGAVYIYEGAGPFSCKIAGTLTRGDLGWALAEGGDVDGNRTNDILIGQPQTDYPTTLPQPNPGPGTVFLRAVLR